MQCPSSRKDQTPANRCVAHLVGSIKLVTYFYLLPSFPIFIKTPRAKSQIIPWLASKCIRPKANHPTNTFVSETLYKMPLEQKWTLKEDQLLLSFVDGEKIINCNEAAKLMNEKAPMLGIEVRIYFPDRLHQRLFELLQPRYRYLLPPLEITDAFEFNLGTNNQIHPAQAGSGPSQTPSSRAEPAELDQNMEREGHAELERYGDPELYEDLVPRLDQKREVGEDDELVTDHGLREEHELFERRDGRVE